MKGDAVSPYVRIVTLVYVFDALTTERSHQKRRTTFEALGIMHREMHGELDPELLRAFVEVMGGRIKL